jgi:phage shock protein PspC (stress-responsive transcriptional regulator)
MNEEPPSRHPDPAEVDPPTDTVGPTADPTTTLGDGIPADDPTSTFGGATAADDPTTTLAGATAAEEPATALGGATPADEPTPTVGGATAAEEPASTLGGVTAAEEPTTTLGGATAVEEPTEVLGDGTLSAPGAGFPPGGAEIPPGGAGFPPAGAEIPPGGAGFPPGGPGFPPGGPAFPPGGGGFPPGGGGFPPGGGGFPPAGAAYPPGPSGTGTPRRLTRSTQRKVIGGVAGGLGEYTGIDPVLFRVLFAVLTLFGGSGILLYGACWLFLPADDQPVSPVESLIGRGNRASGRGRDTTVAAALIAAGLVLAGVIAVGDARDLALCLIIVAGAYFLLRNLRERRAGGPPQPIGPEPPPVAYQAFDVPPAAYQPGATATITAPVAAPPRPPKPPKPRREHSILGVLTVCVLLIVVGITAAVDNNDSTDPDVQTYLAIGTGIIGLGLLVGTVVGRARWLAWLGLPMLALLVVVSTSGIQLDGGVGDRAFVPATASDVQPEYRLGVGSLRLDLSDVDLSEQLVRTKASLGVGDLEIVVPANADVSIDSRSGIGEVLLFGESQDGTSVSRSVVDHGTGSDGRIDLVLDLDVNIGQVRVDRAQA